jgi:hypothetical protein
LQAVIGDDPFDAAQTDGKAGLAQFLGDDFGGSLGIQKAVAQDLPDDLVGAAIRGFGTGLLGQEGGQAALPVVGEHWVIALAAKAVFLRGVGDLRPQALAFDEHEEAAGLLVGGGDGQGAGRAGELVGFGIKLEDRIHGAKIRAGRRLCLITYGGASEWTT